MRDIEDKGDAWLQERSGRSREAGAVARHPVLWYAGGLLVALALLVSFYVVMNQAVARGQQHWAQTGQSQFAAKSEGCGPGRGREGCASGNVEPVSLRTDGPARLTSSGH